MSHNWSRVLDGWCSSPEFRAVGLEIPVSKFCEISDLLIERPNLNSTHLFRADILCDSERRLQTVTEKEKLYRKQPGEILESVSDVNAAEHESQCSCSHGYGPTTKTTATETTNGSTLQPGSTAHDTAQPYLISGHRLSRTVIRRLIPRKPQIDRSLDQSCFVYNGVASISAESSIVVVYVPHVASENEMPWYHPQVKALAYRYEPEVNDGTLAICYKPFFGSADPIPDRLHRTFLALIKTFVRLCKMESPAIGSVCSQDLPASARPVNAASLKDTILPQHIVQDTYTRLKQKYASDLIARWVEKTDPAKHVFEDLSVAAFLIELWKTMYTDQDFPGFADIACGNGVLVYILLKEGYRGHGFDARKRKTWEALDIDDALKEALCVPKPFLDQLTLHGIKEMIGEVKIHDGTFKPRTFIISNHADELTLWTPIMAVLSYEHQKLPFLAIPCCSHALSGTKHRYHLKDVDAGLTDDKRDDSYEGVNPISGDLKALRAEKAKAASHSDDKSAYACLTKKTLAIAEELGYETEMTLMRIPSTRNIGIVGNRHLRPDNTLTKDINRVEALLRRECNVSGGVEASAKIWVDRALTLVEGKGRGKVNMKGNPKHSEISRAG